MNGATYLPLSRATSLSAAFLRHRGRTLSIGEFIGAAQQLATRLPDSQHIINLCGNVHLFLLGFVAALLRKQVTLLPANRLPSTVQQLSERYASCSLLCDHSDEVQLAMRLPLDVCELTDGDLIGQPCASTIPALDGAQLAAILFTSGSTGVPQAIPKHWQTLVTGALANAKASLHCAQPPATLATLVGTVPPQHSYGLETMVMLPLQHYCTISSERPFYPSDVIDALQQVPAPRILVTTPIHLRALIEANRDIPPVASIWSATAPLTVSLAQQAEAQLQAPLHEIFGCTEVGTCATRRPTHSDVWQLLDEFTLQAHPDGHHISAAHVANHYVLQDRLQQIEARQFRLLGRGSDLINIAGKRASLTELNQQLLSIPGVTDGVIFLPDTDADRAHSQRTVALVVAPTLSRAAVNAALRSRIEPAFMPRPLWLVPALPRSETGKLPRQALLALYAELAQRTANQTSSSPP